MLPLQTRYWYLVSRSRPPQDALLDRRRVYKILVEKNIPVPTHILVDREGLPEGEEDGRVGRGSETSVVTPVDASGLCRGKVLETAGRLLEGRLQARWGSRVVEAPCWGARRR